MRVARVNQPTLTERERLLVMAAYLHAKTPRAKHYANTMKVLKQAPEWAGRWSEVTEVHIYDDIRGSVLDDWYTTLIAMTRVPAPMCLMNGGGNLGVNNTPRAHPLFTSCWLNPKGRRLAILLFKEFPQYRPEPDES